jgi:hypothetical protein
MIAQMRPDGILYIKIDEKDPFRLIGNNGVEIFFNPGQVEDLRKEITGSPDLHERIRVWFHNGLNRQPIDVLEETNRHNARNLLAGYLQACEAFGYITHEDAAKLFRELAK